MRLGIDIDDVIYPWFHLAHDACVRAGITDGATIPSQWECWHDYGCTDQQWYGALETATLDGSLYLGPAIDGTIEAMHDLKAAGHTLHLVTARGYFKHGDLIRAHTVDWLRDHGVPHDSLTFSKDKTVINADVFVDDSVKNVTELDAAGTPTFLVDAPHNQGHEHPRRIPSFHRFAELVLALGPLATQTSLPVYVDA